MNTICHKLINASVTKANVTFYPIKIYKHSRTEKQKRGHLQSYERNFYIRVKDGNKNDISFWNMTQLAYNTICTICSINCCDIIPPTNAHFPFNYFVTQFPFPYSPSFLETFHRFSRGLFLSCPATAITHAIYILYHIE